GRDPLRARSPGRAGLGRPGVMAGRTDEGGAPRRAPSFGSRAPWLLAALLFVGHAAAQAPSWPEEPLTNLAHLESLTTEVEVEGERHLGVWIYAEPSPTEAGAYVGREAPGEGVTDLDDVARAVVAYLRHHEATGSERSLELARGLLGYVLAM